MDAVSRELCSLDISLRTLKDDDQRQHTAFSEEMRNQIQNILVNIEFNIEAINDLLSRLASGKLGRRIQWAFTEQDEINKLRSTLESNKSALEVILTIGSISMLAQQKTKIADQGKEIAIVVQQTENISFMTATIDSKIDVLTDLHMDKSEFRSIATEIADLRNQLATISKTNNVFASQSQEFAESLLDPLKRMMDAKMSASGQTRHVPQEKVIKLLSPAPAADTSFMGNREDSPVVSMVKHGLVDNTSTQQLYQKFATARKGWESELQREREQIKSLKEEMLKVQAAKTASLSKQLEDLRLQTDRLQRVKDDILHLQKTHLQPQAAQQRDDDKNAGSTNQSHEDLLQLIEHKNVQLNSLARKLRKSLRPTSEVEVFRKGFRNVTDKIIELEETSSMAMKSKNALCPFHRTSMYSPKVSKYIDSLFEFRVFITQNVENVENLVRFRVDIELQISSYRPASYQYYCKSGYPRLEKLSACSGRIAFQDFTKNTFIQSLKESIVEFVADVFLERDTCVDDFQLLQWKASKNRSSTAPGYHYILDELWIEYARFEGGDLICVMLNDNSKIHKHTSQRHST